MPKVKRLRIFARPNGSGKSILFESFQRNFNPRIFINSDIIEKEILEKGFLDLQQYGLNLNQNDLMLFLQSTNAKTLLQKSMKNKFKIYSTKPPHQ